MTDTVVILISALVTVLGLALANTIIVFKMMAQNRERDAAWKSVVEQALIHIKAETAAEAVNAATALEYNHKMIAEGDVEEDEPPAEEKPAVLRDKVTGREYDIIGGDTSGLF